MALLFWDASSLAKRYFGEVGSDTVNAVFAAAAGKDMATTAWGYAETYSLLVRRLNSGAIEKRWLVTNVVRPSISRSSACWMIHSLSGS
jgi:hypothetical protein